MASLKIVKEELKPQVIKLIEARQGCLGVDLKNIFERETEGRIDFTLSDVFDELVAEKKVEKIQVIVPVEGNSWQIKSIYFPAGTQFWNATIKFVTPN